MEACLYIERLHTWHSPPPNPPPPHLHSTDLALSCGALQRNDIAMAITKFDQFDFLIDIVPRDDLKPPKRQVRELLFFKEGGDTFCLLVLFVLGGGGGFQRLATRELL